MDCYSNKIQPIFYPVTNENTPLRSKLPANLELTLPTELNFGQCVCWPSVFEHILAQAEPQLLVISRK